MDKILKPEDFVLEINCHHAAICPLVCVCKDPSDYPGKYVARLWEHFEDLQPSSLVCVSDSYQEIIRAKPSELTVVPRDQTEDPVIVETWICLE